jgi:anthranilate phosphoribosyltransferase
VRDAVLLNAAAGIAAFDGVTADTMQEVLSAGLEAATVAVDSGAAAEVLDRWIEASRRAQR